MDTRPELGPIPGPARAALEEVLGRDDPEILAVVLTGSAARGDATRHSDVDVMVIRTSAHGPREILRSPAIDEIPLTLEQLEAVAPVGTPGAWTRWSFAWTRILSDRTGGRVSDAVRRQATLTEGETTQLLLDVGRLDEFINFAYRAAKSHRDGRPERARLDSAECLAALLDVAFALNGRVRPYNKYLAWELREHPLASPAWQPDPAIERITGLLDGSPAALRDAFVVVEGDCRARDERTGGHDLGDLIDGWGPDLALLRGVPVTTEDARAT